MLLHLTDHSAEPLHSQVTRQVRARILSGELSEGDHLPSIRKLAGDNDVSVITVKRAYSDMEHEGLIRSMRRKGFVVAALTSMQKEKAAFELLEERLKPMVQDALDNGLSGSQIKRCLEKSLRTRGKQ